jgi:hypothetical protein
VKSVKSLPTHLYSEMPAIDGNCLFCRFRPFKIISGCDLIFVVYDNTRSNGRIDELERIWKEVIVT